MISNSWFNWSYHLIYHSILKQSLYQGHPISEWLGAAGWHVPQAACCNALWSSLHIIQVSAAILFQWPPSHWIMQWVSACCTRLVPHMVLPQGPWVPKPSNYRLPQLGYQGWGLATEAREGRERPESGSRVGWGDDEEGALSKSGIHGLQVNALGATYILQTTSCTALHYWLQNLTE